MRNEISRINRITSLIASLPYFTLGDLFLVFENKNYLKTMLSRYAKSGKIMRLKKGFYVAKEYLNNLEKKNILSDYTEFTANLLHTPSYLSLDWVLYENNLLTESPKNFTSISLSKTATFSNELGNFFYHKIKKELFLGYIIEKKGDFTILKATKAKALFDFLYLRKNILSDKKSIEELRLNFENFSSKDWRKLENYIKLEKSEKMKNIFNNLK